MQHFSHTRHAVQLEIEHHYRNYPCTVVYQIQSLCRHSFEYIQVALYQDHHKQ